ncbi:MAG: LysM peptidoglycan-binding domain-containing protein [Deltaproteobacteria bacterium]|nr:LysM peptidoglycan-binding domain-containing protein [Deltaproteobacteria bacterium]
MTNLKQVRTVIVALLFVLLGSLFADSAALQARQRTHIVKDGDTLWSICEKYYGDPDLWPKLWQMNPFVTNPHFLRPGDVITLIEEEPLKTEFTPPTVKKKKVTAFGKQVPVITGFDISKMTNTNALGYLSLTELDPLGHLISSDVSRLILAKGDKAYASFKHPENISVGDEFSIAHQSLKLDHPLSGKPHGYNIKIRGRLVVRSGIKKSYFETEITETFEEIHVGDALIPFEPVSPCIQPVPTDKNLVASIVSAKNQKKLISKYSIVYIDRGLNHGVRRGNLFGVKRVVKIDDPDFKVTDFVHYFDYKNNPKKMKLHDIVLGHIIILEARPATSTAMVVSTKETFQKGTLLQGLSWIGPPESISNVPMCTIE